MVIDNKKRLVSIRICNFLILLALATAVTLILFFDSYKKPFLGIDLVFAVIVFTTVYLIYNLWGFFRNYHYFYYSDEFATKMVFRFYTLLPFIKQMKSFEIKKANFCKFQVTSKYLGFRKTILLYQLTPKGVAKYPPISISMLRKKEIKKLTESLSQYQK